MPTLGVKRLKSLARAPETAEVGLADRPIWVGWRPETKVPYDPKTGTHAKCDNCTTWALRNDAELWALDGADRGVAIVLTRINAELSLAGIDLDACRDKGAGAIEPWAQEIIDRFATYTEISPSGTGVKVFFRPQGRQSAVRRQDWTHLQERRRRRSPARDRNLPLQSFFRYD